jgi:hypothetical protein
VTSTFHLFLCVELGLRFLVDRRSPNPISAVQGGDDLPTDRRDAGFKRQPCDDLLEKIVVPFYRFHLRSNSHAIRFLILAVKGEQQKMSSADVFK